MTTALRHTRYEVADGVATLTLDRPERLNAWTPTMEEEVRTALGEAERDDAVRVVVLTGAGRGFCAGLDADHLRERVGGAAAGAVNGADAHARPAKSGDFSGRFTYLPAIAKPVIAAVNGPAAGIGFVLALVCDIRFAGSEAFFTSSFARRGLTAEHGSSWLLPRLVGVAQAQDLLLSGRRVAADEALGIGLVNRVVPQDRLLEETREYADEMARSCSPRSLRIIKRQVWEAMSQTLGKAVAVADREMNESFASDDFAEGVAHFLEKRAPRFTGS
jgi:enoyl-CoA hydratase/carnithine racemase